MYSDSEVQKLKVFGFRETSTSANPLIILLMKLLQISVSAVEESTVVTWSFDDLSMIMTSHPVLKTVLHTLVGKDITLKLYQVWVLVGL